MSVVGFDVGNESGVVAIARQRGIDVVLNDESKRETPTVISFGESQRFLGSAGAASALMNVKNTVSQMKRFIGKKFNDPEVQNDIPMFPFKVIEGPNGEPLIEVTYLNETKTFTPTQILAMVLVSLKTIGEKNLEAPVVDCVIGIPAYLTDLQRRRYLDAATIAGLQPLRLMHETTATALAYGIYKTDLPDKDPVNVAFVDVGHSSLQVSVVAFKKGQLKVLSYAYDKNLGGRDFDQVLFDHFADKFKIEHKIDVRSNNRASLRLRTACEKLKKVLSANPEAPLNIECLMEEKDVRSFIRRDEFEQLSTGVLNRVLAPCEKAVRDSGLTLDQIASVELIGSGSRVPSLVKIVSSFFGKECRRTMNASESVARGCALQCAMLSPTFKVRDFEVQDMYPFSISLSWKRIDETNGDSGAMEEDSAPLGENNSKPGSAGDAASPFLTQVVFPLGNPVPSSKLLTFYRTEPFSIEALYSEGVEASSARIGTFSVGPFPAIEVSDSVKHKLKVKIRLNLHGIVSVESATLLEEEAEKKEDAKMVESDKASPSPSTDAPASATSEAGEASPADSSTHPAPADATAPPQAKKKKTKKTDILVSSSFLASLSPSLVSELRELELEMGLQDKVMEETKEKKNAVEAYVYAMRNAVCDKLDGFATESEKEALMNKLQQTEDWLYEEGENEKKGVYAAKLEELKKMGDVIESRSQESESRKPLTETLTTLVNAFAQAAGQEGDVRYDHISKEEKKKVLDECEKTSRWLNEMSQRQSVLSKSDNPVLLSADLKRRAEELDRFCRPIMTKPKPAPPPSPAPSATANADGSDAKAEGSSKGATGDAMETEEKAGDREGAEDANKGDNSTAGAAGQTGEAKSAGGEDGAGPMQTE